MHRSPAIVAVALAACGDLGLTPVVAEDADASAAEEGAWLTVEPTGDVRFGRAAEDGAGVEQEVVATSAGALTVTLDDAWIEGTDQHAFSFSEEPRVPVRLAPGESTTLRITFAPDAQGSFRGVLALDIESGQLVERSLVGEGCADANRDERCD